MAGEGPRKTGGRELRRGRYRNSFEEVSMKGAEDWGHGWKSMTGQVRALQRVGTEGSDTVRRDKRNLIVQEGEETISPSMSSGGWEREGLGPLGKAGLHSTRQTSVVTCRVGGTEAWLSKAIG